MAFAENLGRLSRSVEGSVAFPLAPTGRALRPEARPMPRRKNGKYAVILMLLSWAAVIMLSAVLVQQNSFVQVEMRTITAARQELALLQQQNLELQTQLVQSQSVGAVERWAIASGMNRPAVVRTLKGDPSAVATRQEIKPAPSEAKGPLALVASVREYLARWIPVRIAAGR